MIDVNVYPESYENIVTDQQMELISDWFNSQLALRNLAYETWHDDNFSEGLRKNAEKANAMYHNTILGAQNVLKFLGIYIEHDWIGHEDKYFFATKEDAIAQNNKIQETVEPNDKTPGDCGC